MVDQLANEYAGQPVVFLEQAVDHPLGNRYGRWWAAYGSGGSVTLPLVMVDSGYQISNGYVDFYSVYKTMVDAALARPPQAEITAYEQRIGDTLYFYGELTNLSGVTLSVFDNAAALSAIVYEDAHVGVTDRIVRATAEASISPDLAPGETMTFTLQAGLSGVDWDRLHAIVLADYRPGGQAGPYDMLQAAYTTAPTFTAQPDALTFLVAPGDPASLPITLDLQGPHVLNWTAATDALWLQVTPGSGSMATRPDVAVVTGSLSPGWQQGNITFTASSAGGLYFTEQVSANAFYGPVERVYLPLVTR